MNTNIAAPKRRQAPTLRQKITGLSSRRMLDPLLAGMIPVLTLKNAISQSGRMKIPIIITTGFLLDFSQGEAVAADHESGTSD